LAALSGDDIDAEVTARLADAEGDEQLALVRLVGMRRIDAVPALLALVHGRDPAVRSAALTALGEVARLEDVSVLIERAVNSGDDDEAAVALAALRAACVRMPNREACAQRLSDAMTDASAEAQKNMLTTLSMMGGETALQAIRSAALSNDDDMQDAATRLLGSWMSVDAGPVLLELATSPEGSYQVRALRGYLRLARQFQMTDAERAEMCRQAWRAAERDAERKLVLEVAERYPSSEMLDVVVDSCLQGPLKDDATRVIASAIEQAGGQIDAAHLVEQLAGGPVELEIVKATYGAGERQKDVTAAVAKLAGNRPLIALPPESYNDLFDGDPAPGVTKTLTIEYRLDGKTGKAEAQENSRLVLLTRQK
ncbi:MAG: hypothetical protein KDA63_01310, partial [Planctomycetales bacterium]|nr:hypothetical protein [Planctomycetales bacterium]